MRPVDTSALPDSSARRRETVPLSSSPGGVRRALLGSSSTQRKLSLWKSAAPCVVWVSYVSILLLKAGVPWVDIVAYAAYMVVFVTFPGVVGWRLLWTGGRGSWLGELVFGTLLGCVLQLPVYVLGVLCGVPRLPAALPVVMLLVCAVRTDRRQLLWPRRPVTDPVLSWGIALISAYALTWIARFPWSTYAYARSAPANPSPEQTFQLSLVGELRHHLPPEVPFVDGQQLGYHWFVHAHIAASSWLSPVDPMLVIDRLLAPGLILLTIAGVALLAQEVAGGPWAGVTAAALYGVVGDFDPFSFSVQYTGFYERKITTVDHLSPTHLFGTALFVLVLMVGVHMLRTCRPTAKDWILWVVVMVGISGAKATFVPMVLAGLSLVLLYDAVMLRRLRRQQLGLWISTALAMLFAQYALFRGQSQGVHFHLFNFAPWVANGMGLIDASTSLKVSPEVQIVVVMGALVAWTASAAGVAGLLYRRTWRDPVALFLGGIALSGFAAGLTLGHTHLAELFFIYSASIPLAIASAWGLAVLVRRSDAPRARLYVGLAFVAGGVVTLVAQTFGPQVVPVYGEQSEGSLIRSLLVPYVVAICGLLVVVTFVFLLTRRSQRLKALLPALLIAPILGLGLNRVVSTVEQVLHRPWVTQPAPQPATAGVGPGGVAAARWLNTHSNVDDLVATNVHWANPSKTDTRAFWISGYAERHVLVEGWAYAPPTLAESARTRVRTWEIPFWDGKLLAENDATFARPSEATVAALKARGVRWMFLDKRFPSRPRELGKHAQRRFKAGSYFVFEIHGN